MRRRWRYEVLIESSGSKTCRKQVKSFQPILDKEHSELVGDHHRDLLERHRKKLLNRQQYSRARSRLMQVDTLSTVRFPVDLVRQSPPFPFTNAQIFVPTEQQLSLQQAGAVEQRRDFFASLTNQVDLMERKFVKITELTFFYQWMNNCCLPGSVLENDLASLSIAGKHSCLPGEMLPRLQQNIDFVIDELVKIAESGRFEYRFKEELKGATFRGDIHQILIILVEVLRMDHAAETPREPWPYFIKSVESAEQPDTLDIQVEINRMKLELKRRKFRKSF